MLSGRPIRTDRPTRTAVSGGAAGPGGSLAAHQRVEARGGGAGLADRTALVEALGQHRAVLRLEGGVLQGTELLADVIGEGGPEVALVGAQIGDIALQLVALVLQRTEQLGAAHVDLVVEVVRPVLRIGEEALGVDPGLGLGAIGAGLRVGGDLVGLPVGDVDGLVRLAVGRSDGLVRLAVRGVDGVGGLAVGALDGAVGLGLGLGDEPLRLLGGHLDEADHRGAGLGGGGDDDPLDPTLDDRCRRHRDGLGDRRGGHHRLGLGDLDHGLELRGGLLGLGGVLRRLLERLDLAPQHLVLLHQLREGRLHPIDEEVDIGHLVARTPSHVELGVAHFVKRQCGHTFTSKSSSGPDVQRKALARLGRGYCGRPKSLPQQYRPSVRGYGIQPHGRSQAEPHQPSRGT
ncbi:hypothetical protein SDC9_73992 [bioreactor metagenome]|uniref:Uncharacterized protein n=1 Tax=bioreactor metagenome TaxID=1076179 RepID=A0A644YHW4_9ZZZZ